MKPNPAQCKAARALLSWPQTRLATAAGLDPATVNAFERGKHVSEDSLWRIQQALEAEVIFLNSESPGVRLKPKAREVDPR